MDANGEVIVNKPIDAEQGAFPFTLYAVMLTPDGKVDKALKHSMLSGPALDLEGGFGSAVADVGDLDGKRGHCRAQRRRTTRARRDMLHAAGGAGGRALARGLRRAGLTTFQADVAQG